MIDYFALILGGTKVESHETEPGVYQHTFTPPKMRFEQYLPPVTWTVEDIDLTLKPDEMPTFVLSGKMQHRLAMQHLKAMARLRRLERRRKIERRKFRAAFRRRKRGQS